MGLKSRTVNYRDIHYEFKVSWIVDDETALKWFDGSILKGYCEVTDIKVSNWSTVTQKPAVDKNATIEQIASAVSYDRDYVSGIIVRCKYKGKPIKIELDLRNYIITVVVRKKNSVHKEDLLMDFNLN